MDEPADGPLVAVLDALDAGDIAGARVCAGAGLAARPGDARLWSVAGLCARLAGDGAEAERCWQRAIDLQPDANTCNRLGELLVAQGRLQEALGCYAAAADAGLADAVTWGNLGVLRMQAGEAEAAETAYGRALALAPGHVRTRVNLGVLLAADGRLVAAEQAYREALDGAPDDVAAHTNLGLVLEEARRYGEAEAHQRHALALAPGVPEVHCHLADLLARQPGGAADAEHHYHEALRLRPGYAIAHSNLGALRFDQGRTEEAEAEMRTALALQPDFAAARLNLGQLLLSLGRLQEGWPHVELRYTLRVPGAMPGFPAHTRVPRWAGEPLAGRSLLVWPEQGHGDQTQFCRYLAILRAQQRPARLTFACSAPLVPLLRSVAGPDAVIAQHEAAAALEQHDFWVPLLSLPLLCGTTLATIPGETPYLCVEPALADRWAARLPPHGLRVGLVWRGNVQHDNDADRSLPGLATLAPLWQVPGVQFISLQKMAGEDEAQHPPAGQPLLHLGTETDSFADTAAVMAGLDLLVAVDTAACHVAGAIGLPCWVLLPAFRNDWRWLRGRDDSPWYPGMRLFQQPVRGDWATPVAQVAAALAARASAR
ncbi:MAG: tetratricopeptide repeat protein [Pseudomonadota bacterium]